MSRSLVSLLLACAFLAGSAAQAATVVPNEIRMPGTQPNEVGNFESPDKCDNCHAGYNNLDPGAEPATGWRGGAMGNAGRDPVFWATLGVAEQDFDGAGDLCIRCHSAGGWYGGRSTPTDGSGLAASDDNGIDCDTCHASTDTDNTGINPSTGGLLAGVMNSPFIANCNPDPNVPDKCSTTGSAGEGFYGSGMLSLWAQVNEKLGPFGNAQARHQWQQSAWHRDPDFCGTCHDVSNAAVGDLAPGNGAQPGNPNHVVSSQDYTGTGLPNLGGPIGEKAAFNNPPYAYGVVERTFSEYKSSPLWNTPVSDFTNLPADLQNPAGSLAVTYQAAIQAGTGGDYADGTERYFSCQSCHMRPVGTDNGGPFPGCNKNGVPLRADLPRHDHTGGNYWFASMTQYQDNAGTLRLGGGLNSTQLLAMDLGTERATRHLREAGALSVTGNTVTVTNLTGHKLITGYPEGRRMWLNIKWYDDTGTLMREDGKYGTLQTNLDLDGNGQPDAVETILDLGGANTEIYEAHYAMTRDWANILMAVGYPAAMVLSYDRVTGQSDCTLGQLAGHDDGGNPLSPCDGGAHPDYHNTFHFALNNHVSSDNRIPPYRMSYTEARKRNALPVPETRYSRSGDVYEHADNVQLSPPAGAVYASIDLLYQGTSWEYILFLQMANNGTNAFLGGEGNAMLDAWLNADVVKSTGAPITGVQMVNGDYRMVPPVVMASAEWGIPPVCNPTPGQENTETSCQDGVDNDCDGQTDASDPDCAPVCVPTGQTETACDDGLDDDCDGLFDCDDSDCTDDPACTTGMACSEYATKAECNNDTNCTWSGSPKNGSCQDAGGGTPTEVCDNGIDDDGDGLVDCNDGDCTNDPACQQTTCNNNGVCEPGEDCTGCSSDCDGVTGGKPANRYCCGNGIVESAEGDGSVCDGNY